MVVGGITINITLSQIAVFFTVAGIGTIVVSSLLIEQWASRRGSNTIVGCASAVIAGAVLQTISALVLYAKASIKQTWIYIQVGIILLYIVCFSILLADAEKTAGTSQSDAFFAVVAINWILLFLVVGLLSKNSVPVGILFCTLGIAVIISCSLVIDDFANAKGSSYADKILGCSSTALVAAFAQTISSAFLFFKDDMKTIWLYTNSIVTVVFIICFAVPMAGGIKGFLATDYYYTTLVIDFVFLFVVVGMMWKNKIMKD